MTGFTVERLDWEDEELGSIPLPKGAMEIRSGFGSGLAVRAGDEPGTVWAVGDRGPNIKPKDAVELYGLEALAPLGKESDAKIMPRLDIGPAIAELRVEGKGVRLVRTLRILDSEGRPVSGLPVPGGEPAFDLDGKRLEPDPGGLDTEGIVALGDGCFWVGDEFGPSLVRLDPEGRVLKRLRPGAGLPEIAGRRQLNRGFEALAVSPDAAWLFLAFQSPLAHPDETAHERGRHVRLWRLDAASGAVAAQYLYPLDPPESFRRDSAKGEIGWSDLKVSELVWVAEDKLLVLERGSETTKIYRVPLGDEAALPAEHLHMETRPSVEELSGGGSGFGLPVLAKELVFSSDDAPKIAADLEGMVILSPSELLLVSDNDFGVEGARTSFWRVRFEAPILC